MSIASAEIRKIAVKAYLSGKVTPQQLADILGFHMSAIVRWVREYKKDGRLKPQTREHMPRAFSVEESERLSAWSRRNRTSHWRKSERHFQKVVP